MNLYSTEAAISKDPVVGLVQKSSADDDANKLVAIIGSAMDDAGKLIVPTPVTETAQELAAQGINMAYTPSSGLPGLAPLMSEEFIGKKTLKELEAQGIKRAELVCSGGTNAISVALMTCTSEEDDIVSHNPHWAGYDSISLALKRKTIKNFEMLDTEGQFNSTSFTETIAKTGKKLTLLINTPFDNPLGQDFGKAAWEKMGASLAQELSKDPEKEALLVLDTAYLDFGPGGKDYSRLNFLIQLFKTVPKLNVVIAGTASKSFAMYGARVGVATLLSADEDSINKWKDTAGGTIRGTFSNATRFGQEIVLSILQDMNKLAHVHDFQMKTSDLIAERTKFLIETLSADDLFALEPEHTNQIKILQPAGGFFCALKINDKVVANKIFDDLLESHTYVPLIADQFLRIPVCGLNQDKLAELSKRIIETSKMHSCTSC